MINVIIADDDATVRKGLVKLIPWAELGAQVILAAEDGEEALNALNKIKVDLIISDIRMPNMDGIELARHIHRQAYDVNMVLLSAYAEFEYAKEAIKYGIREFVLKPISREKIKNLSDIIRDVAREKSERSKLSALIHDTSFKKKIRKALDEGHVDYLKEASILDETYKSAGMLIVKEYYLLMIDVLCDFAADKGIEFVNKQEILSEFLKLNDAGEYGDFIINKIVGVLSLKKNAEKNRRKKTIEYIKEYINDNYAAEDLSTASLANYLNLSGSYISSLFKSIEDKTIVEYITNKRIEKAAEILKDTNISVGKISKLVGYNDMRYFVTVFRKNVGMSPSEYRKWCSK